MRNLHLLHSLRMQNTKLTAAQVVCVDINTKTVFCITDSGIYGLDPATQQIIQEVSLVEAGYLSRDGAVSVVGAEYLADQTSVCLATSRGDLVLWNTVTNEMECVGSVEHGLTAMCWSTDQELLILSTGQNTLIMMTREFDPVSETPMFSDQFGEAQFVNVGWGKKETQFHGTEGKDAASKKTECTKPAFEWDDKKPRICWHGDGQFFVVSAIHPQTGSRQLCVWTREGVLHSTSEQVSGVEHALGWKSTGNLITTSQRKPNKHDIIFFEKNGLRHGEFTLPFGVNDCKVLELTWNTESNILAVWIEDLPKGEGESIPNSYIQLWTVGNYHWYLKQSLKFTADAASRVSALCWDQEQAYRLHVMCHGGQYLQYTWAWSADHSRGSDDADLMNVAVIDGARILVTPFRQTVVPPPMAAYQLELSAAVNQVVFAPPTAPNDIAVILDDNRLAVFSFEQGKSPPAVCGGVKVGACCGNGFAVKCTTPCSWQEYSLEGEAGGHVYPCKYSHVMWIDKDVLLLCAANSAGTLSQLHRAQIQHSDGTVKIISSQDLEGYLYNTAISVETGHIALQLTDGTVLQYDTENDTVMPWMTASGEELSLYTAWKLCSYMDIATIGGEEVLIGLTDRYQLYVNNIEVATNCTSYALHDEFLLLTTYAHTCRCICRKTNVKVLSSLADGKAHPFDESVRRVERGSRIVCVVPEDTKVVLQMPRGNLETIHPRALVLSAVRRQLDRFQFKAAFNLMRKHRINMNLIYDHNPASFLDKVDQFIQQVSAPNLINQFLTDLQEEDVTKTMYTAAYIQESLHPTSQPKVKVSKIDIICDHMRAALQRIDPDKFLLSILTAYVRKSAPELDTALKLIKDLKGRASSGVVSAEDALKYLLFLVDVNELYDIALGTYDFDLVLLVAEKSQKDPKEYIPFLNSLRKMEENYQHYTIDKYLKRYTSALGNIVKCGDVYFTECLDLIKEQRLHREGLALYKLGSIHYKEIAVEYAKFLLEKKHPEEAGLILSKAEEWSAAVEAFEKSLNWRLALCMAHRAGYQGHAMEELCKRLASNLKEQNRHTDAATIYEQHLNDIEEAIVTLIEGSQWEEALRLMHKSSRTDFIETHFSAALVESQSNYLTLLQAVKDEFERHKNRLTLVRAQKEKARLEFLEGGELNTADADLFSDTSSATGESAISGRSASQMTADSQRSSIFSKKTGRSAKNRRKQERKKWSLKEGSAHEDIALIEALSKACKQVEEWKGDISSLLRMLMMFHHQNEAELLQDAFDRLLAIVEKSVTEIWPDDEMDQGSDFPTLGPHSTANAIAQAVQQGKVPTSEVKIDPSLRIPPPLTRDNKWKLHSSDIHR